MKWKCPKCGREFSRIDQQHYCGKPETIDEYIESQDEPVQEKLREVAMKLHKEGWKSTEYDLLWIQYAQISTREKIRALCDELRKIEEEEKL